MVEIAENAKQGRRRHHWSHSKRRVTQFAEHDTEFSVAARILRIATDKALAEILDNRVVPGTVRAWRNGARDAPRWALDVLWARVEQLQATIDYARLLKAQKEKAGG